MSPGRCLGRALFSLQEWRCSCKNKPQICLGCLSLCECLLCANTPESPRATLGTCSAPKALLHLLWGQG